jgi:carboxyl-terminal processing protease
MAQEAVMTLKTRVTVLLISTPVLAFIVVGGLMGNASATRGDETFQHLRVFEDVIRLVMNNYVEEVKVDRVMEGAMRGLADGLDPDSAYLNPKQLKEVESGAALPDGDVGVELTRSYYLRVIAARDSSPGAKAGLATGDVVRSIDGKPTREMSVFEGTRLLRGQPGSKVTLIIIRNNAADPHEVTLIREKRAVVAVSGRMLDGEIGYLRIPSFHDGVVEGVRQQAASLSKTGAKSLVVDIRRTAEGSIDNGIAAARLFVKSGTLAQRGSGQKDKEAAERIDARAGDGAIELPVLLLVTTGTSGAAEVFAAALDGRDRAELIGERTLGRAGVQKLVKLPENRGLWLTYARYSTPAGQPIHGKGLVPDVEVEENDVEFGAAIPQKDPILDAATERLKTRKG